MSQLSYVNAYTYGKTYVLICMYEETVLEFMEEMNEANILNGGSCLQGSYIEKLKHIEK